MSQQNPYQPPAASLDVNIEQTEDIEKIASGQRLLIFAILINIVSIFLQMAIGPIAGLVSIVAIVILLVGIVRLASGMGKSPAISVLLVLLLFLPLINLIILLRINSKATKKLRDAGNMVGLLGVSKQCLTMA